MARPVAAIRSDLAHAERHLLCAEMADNFRISQKEIAVWQPRVDALRDELAEAEERALPGTVAR